MFKQLLTIGLLAGFASAAAAGNNNNNNQNGPTTENNQTYNQPVAHGGAGGNGYGGSAIANGGSAFGGNANVGDIRNTNSATGGSVLGSGNSTNSNVNTALGGQGGTGLGVGVGVGVGGNADQSQKQGQQQGQGQSQSNVGLNSQGQSLSNATSTATSTSTNQSQTSSANNNGNEQSTNVTLNEAAQPDRIRVDQAPQVFTSAPNATVSCYKTGGGGVSAWFGGASFSGGKIDEACETRELVRLTTDAKSATNLLCTFEVFQLANREKCAGIPIVHMLANSTRRAIVQPQK
jgi:hypothetical protein